MLIKTKNCFKREDFWSFWDKWEAIILKNSSKIVY